MARIPLLAIALFAATLPAAMAHQAPGRAPLSAAEGVRQASPFSLRAAARFGRCVAKADAAASLRYIRAEAGTQEETRARAALQPMLDRCELSLGSWQNDVDEAGRRTAVRDALIRERML
jgi:hypothetical protein